MRTRIGQLLARCGGARPRGFTLIEMLVAVGAVALVGVAIATVFEAVGKTVGTGKRMATLNSYANLIQQQMARDVASMTRQGFLVIRNEMADADADGVYDAPSGAGGRGSDAIPLDPDDLSPRPRRIDEWMFFVKGDFTTAREALDPRFIARADAASIYYGMGKRRRSNSVASGEYLRPTLDDTNDSRDADNVDTWLGQQVAGNPNRYASDWTLLRMVRLLAAERNTQNLASSAVLGFPPISPKLEDYDDQVALQPAASNLFRALYTMFPDPATTPADRIRPASIFASHPAFSTGLVDIATTSLEEIRLIVTTADTWPGTPPYAGEEPAGPEFFAPVTGNAGDPNDFPDGDNAGVDGKSRRTDFTNGTGSDQYLVARMQSWMMDAFPSWNTASNVRQDRARVRYEPEPPNYLDVLANQTGLTLAELRADQLMLSSSSFVPRCTEFIVEWSYGKTWPSETTSANYRAGHEGELIWHGMERMADGAPPAQTFNEEDAVARPYGDYPLNASWEPAAGNMNERFRKVDGTYGSLGVDRRLIHGQEYDPAVLNPGEPVTSYFGYSDPTFNPDANNDGMLVSPGDSAQPTVPWAWPRLIRVTIGLADPNDPGFEQRYQFVYTLPEEPAP